MRHSRTLLLLTLAGCTGPATEPSDPLAALYPDDRVVEIRVDLPAADWELLRNEKPPETVSPSWGPGCLPVNNPGWEYTWFQATVTIDGTVLEDAGVRKKGWCGSQSTDKPALKIKLDEFVAGQELHGADELALNNSVQDPSYVRQCMGYRLFDQAGLPSSHCAFTQVFVNGEDQGVYVSVEPVEGPYLRRAFGEDEGNLYEGNLADFRDRWVDVFEKKRNEEEPDRSDLDAVVSAAAEAIDRDALDEVVDVEQFVDFWAMESLIGHVDGYAGNTNNFLVYASDGRFRFLPWGIDATFGFFTGVDAPVVYANGVLAHRLYQDSSTRQEYLDAYQRLLDEVWDEDALLAEVERMTALVATVTDVPPSETARINDYLEARRAAVEAVLAAPPDSAGALPGDPDGAGGASGGGSGELDALFETTWDSLAVDPFAAGSGQLTVVVAGSALDIAATGASAGANANGERILQIAGALSDGGYVMVIVSLGTVEPVAGEPFLVTGIALRAPGGGEFTPLGMLSGATLTLSTAGNIAGSPFAGTLAADLTGLQ